MESFLGGVLAGGATDLAFYGLDSYKTKVQALPAPERLAFQRELWRGRNVHLLFRGVLPVISLGSAPCLGVFFVLYDACGRHLRRFGIDDASGTLLSAAAAAVPASLLGNPADTLKKQLMVRVDVGVMSAFSTVHKARGVSGFFVGWEANLLKDVPFAGIKMGLYESVRHFYRKFTGREESGLDTAAIGFGTGVITAVLTNPLDVGNSLLKARAASKTGTHTLASVLAEEMRSGGARTLFRGLGPRTLIIGFGSTVFWTIYEQVKSFAGSSRPMGLHA